MRYLEMVSVQQRTSTEGSAGQTEWTASGAPIDVRCNVHPLEADEIQFWGDHGRDMRKVFCKTWPGDIQNIITWDGSEWDQVAPEQRFKIGSTTRHIEVIIRRR